MAKVADSIAAEVLNAPVAGVAIGVARGGDVVYRKAYGLSDVAAQAPLTLEDEHQIGSLTKQFTAAAVMQLVEQGRIALDDPVQEYLPEFDTRGHTVTIHHLLNHTSGIRSYPAIYGMNPVPRETVLDTIQKHAYDFAPGERFLYNNSGYYLLGVILEAVTGAPYAQYLQERFFEPLGLASTSYCGYEGREVPVGYTPGDNGLTTARLSDMEFPGAAGGLCSTVDDLLVWQRALVTGDVVGADSYERMTTPASLDLDEPMTYGYGIGVDDLEGERRIVHGGGIPGYNAYLSYYPADSLGIVVLVNTLDSWRIQEALVSSEIDDQVDVTALRGVPSGDRTEKAKASDIVTLARAGLGLDVVHTFTPSPDGNYAVTETEYQYTPLRIWDLTAAQRGEVENLDTPLSAWTADWRALAHNHEVRWPYVFVSAYEDGLQVFNLEDPKHPKTDGGYYTCECKHEHGFGGNPANGYESTNSVMQGAFGVDVRNSDGLIVLSDIAHRPLAFPHGRLHGVERP